MMINQHLFSHASSAYGEYCGAGKAMNFSPDCDPPQFISRIHIFFSIFIYDSPMTGIFFNFMFEWLRHAQDTATDQVSHHPGPYLSRWVPVSMTISPDPFYPVVKHPSTTIKTHSKVPPRHLWPAESNRNINLPLPLLVPAVVAKTSPNFGLSKFHCTTSTTHNPVFH